MRPENCSHKEWTEYYHQIHDMDEVAEKLNELEKLGWDVGDPVRMESDVTPGEKWLITADIKRCNCPKRRRKSISD